MLKTDSTFRRYPMTKIASVLLTAVAIGASCFGQTVLTEVRVGQNPAGLAIDPGVAKLYVAHPNVANNQAPGYISIIPLPSLTPVRTRRFEDSTGIGCVPLSGNPVCNVKNHLLYITNLNCNSVSVFDGQSETLPLLTTVKVEESPSGIAINPETNLIYVGNSYNVRKGGRGSVSVIDGEMHNVVTTVQGIAYPQGIAVNSLTNRVYVTGDYNPDDNINGFLYVIDGSRNELLSTSNGSPILIPVELGPVGVAINPITNRIYVANTYSDSISVVDGDSNIVIDRITVCGEPLILSLNPATNRLYVPNYKCGTLSIVDTTEKEILAVTVGSQPVGTAVDSGAGRVYVSNYGSGTVSVVTDDPPSVFFLRGDSNSDGVVDIADPIHTLSLLFLAFGELNCEDSADSNDDGKVDISDGLATLSFLFLGIGQVPDPGFERCGPDPTWDRLPTCRYNLESCPPVRNH